MMNIVIPMAGKGQRFKDAGFPDPKPLIKLPDGRTMIEAVVDNLGLTGHYIFLVQSDQEEAVAQALEKFKISKQFISIDEYTAGAAATVLKAKDQINTDVPLFIANCDQLVQWNPDYFESVIQGAGSHLDGLIQTILTTDPSFSYARIDAVGYVDKVAEKEIISEYGTTGLYFWKRGADFVKYAEKMIAENKLQNNEFYVCPVYQEAIDDGRRIGTYVVEKMYSLGTPEHLKQFIKDMLPGGEVK